MKRLGWMVILFFFVAPASAHPSFAPAQPETVWVQGEAGWTYAWASFEDGSFSVSLARSISPRVDVVATFAGGDLFRLAARFLLVRDLLPLNVAAECSTAGISLLSTLFLGPVHVAFGRSWLSTPTRIWGLAQLAPRSDVLLAFGLESVGGRIGASCAFTWLPFAGRMIALSIQFARSGPTLSIGGVW
jgi:hypothetical protein